MVFLDYFKILRPLNCAIAGFAALIGYWIALGSIVFNANSFLAFVAVFLICGAGQAVNDFFDLRIDRKKNSKKVLVEERIPVKNALYFGIVFFFAGVLFSIPLGITAFEIAVIMSVLLFVYSAFLCNFKFLGNWIVALGTAMTLVFGASIVENYSIVLWLFWPMLFANLARELIKDLEDLKADAGMKKTLPMIFGVKKARLIVELMYAFAVLIGFCVFVFGITKSHLYVLLVFLSAIVFFLSTIHLRKNNFSKAQEFAKAGMIFALLAYLSILF